MYRYTLGFIAISATLAGALLVATSSWGQEPISIADVKRDGPVDFNKEVLPVLRAKCLACHNESEAESDLVLESPAAILKGGLAGPAVIAGKGEESFLLQLAAAQDEPVMPPEDNEVGARPFTPQELGILKLWIDQGAKGPASTSDDAVKWQKLPANVNPIFALAISADGQFAAAGRANQIFLYHIPSQRELGRLTDPRLVDGSPYSAPGIAHMDLVQSLCFSDHGDLLVSGGYRTVKFWRRHTKPKPLHLPVFGSPTTAMATSSSGKWLACGQADGHVVVLDTSTGEAVSSVEAHTGAVSNLRFSSDGELLVSASREELRIWNRTQSRCIATAKHTSEVHAIALLAEDHQLAVAGLDHQIQLWQMPDEAALSQTDAVELQTARVPAFRGHTGPVTALCAVAANNPQLVSGSQDGTVRIWDIATGREIRKLNHGGPVTAVDATRDGTRYASAGSKGSVKLWDAKTGKQQLELKDNLRARLKVEALTHRVAVAKRMITAAQAELKAAKDRKDAEEKNANAADEARKKAEETLNGKKEAAQKALAAKESADKTLAAAKAELEAADDAAREKKEAEVKRLEAEAKKLADPAKKATDERQAAERALQSATTAAKRARQSAERAAAATPEFEQHATQAEEASQQIQKQLDAAKERQAAAEPAMLDVAFSPDGQTVATCDEAQVQTWDATTGTVLEVHEETSAPIMAIAFHDAQEVWSATRQGTVDRWKTNPHWVLERTIGDIESAETLSDRVTALDLSPDGQWLATGGGEPSRSGEMKIWRVADGKLERTIEPSHSDTVLSLAFSPDGSQLASGGADRFARVFDISSGELVRAFEGHTHHVTGVDWRADGRWLATSGADNVVKVWNSRTGEQLRTITGFTKEVTALCFLAATDQLAASSGDTTVQIKDATNGRNVRTLGDPSDFVHAVAADDLARYILAGGQDSVLRVWRDNGQLLVDFESNGGQ